MKSGWMTQAWLDRAAVVATLAYLALMTWLLLAPAGVLPQVAGGDKFHHVAAFAALVFPGIVARPSAAGRIMLAAVVYGAAMECIQPSFGRSAEWLDLAADAVGVLVGYGLARLVRRHLPLAQHAES